MASPLRIKDSYLPGKKPQVSFEFFPPKNEEMEKNLWHSIMALQPLKPAFVSVTYGAGGTTRERTHQTVVRILKETSLTPAAHLTCVGSNTTEIEDIAKTYWEAGVRHIVALRGDPPHGETKYTPVKDGLAHAIDLVKLLKKVADFDISVAAFPEGHPEARSLDDDLDHLKRKLDAGATRAITQFFFDTDYYFRFIERVLKAGITAPIIPGIVPIANYAQIVKFSKMCAASIPDWLHAVMNGLDEIPEQRDMMAFLIASEQCRELANGGVTQFHFYTLNRAPLTRAVCRTLGVS